MELTPALKRHFGFDSFRPGQEAVVRAALDNRDVLAIMPTGGGKSLCFQLPALLREGVTLVVSPLIALMQDQVRLLADNGISAAFLNSSLDASELGARTTALLRGEYKLVYLAPERLVLPEFLNGVLPRLHELQHIAAFVIDEAHCVSEWGHDFRPEYRQLAQLRGKFPTVSMLAFTATATPRVRDDIVQQLALRNPFVHVASFNRPNLYYAVRPKNKRSYTELLARARESKGSGIVYCQSRKRVDELAAQLRTDGIAALPYHAGMEQADRKRNQEAFVRDDAQVIVATIAFGMGINKPDVRWVAHYDLPRSLESYYQESGRAGRDGDPAQCIFYFGAADIRTAEYFIAQKIDPQTQEPLEEEQRIARHQLRQVLNYAEATECRRAIQLRYFGEVLSEPCNNCDSCLEPRDSKDWTTQAQQFLSCVARLAQRRERFGAAYLIEILRGGQTARIRERGHEQLSVYGIGKAHSVDEWRALARTLLHQGLMTESQDGYPVLALNDLSWEVLRGQRAVHIAESRKQPRERRGGKRRHEAAASTNDNQTLFDRLRVLRKRIADEQRLPPYVIFHDATLREIAERKPITLEEFARIPGVGQAKLTRYAQKFIDELKAHS